MRLRPALPLSIASAVVCVALFGCGGSTKTTAGARAGTTGAQSVVGAPAGGSSTKSSGTTATPGTAPTPSTTSSAKGSSSPPESQPFTGSSAGKSTGTSTGSRPPTGNTKSHKAEEAPVAAALAACERAIAQKRGILSKVKAEAKQICKQAATRVLSQSGGVEREVCERVANSSHLPVQAKAQALAHCKTL